MITSKELPPMQWAAVSTVSGAIRLPPIQERRINIDIMHVNDIPSGVTCTEEVSTYHRIGIQQKTTRPCKSNDQQLPIPHGMKINVRERNNWYPITHEQILTSLPPTMDWMPSPLNKLALSAETELMKVSAKMLESVGRVNWIFIAIGYCCALRWQICFYELDFNIQKAPFWQCFWSTWMRQERAGKSKSIQNPQNDQDGRACVFSEGWVIQESRTLHPSRLGLA
jgi:hypothetical protein